MKKVMYAEVSSEKISEKDPKESFKEKFENLKEKIKDWLYEKGILCVCCDVAESKNSLSELFAEVAIQNKSERCISGELYEEDQHETEEDDYGDPVSYVIDKPDDSDSDKVKLSEKDISPSSPIISEVSSTISEPSYHLKSTALGIPSGSVAAFTDKRSSSTSEVINPDSAFSVEDEEFSFSRIDDIFVPISNNTQEVRVIGSVSNKEFIKQLPSVNIYLFDVDEAGFYIFE